MPVFVRRTVVAELVEDSRAHDALAVATPTGTGALGDVAGRLRKVVEAFEPSLLDYAYRLITVPLPLTAGSDGAKALDEAIRGLLGPPEEEEKLPEPLRMEIAVAGERLPLRVILVHQLRTAEGTPWSDPNLWNLAREWGKTSADVEVYVILICSNELLDAPGARTGLGPLLELASASTPLRCFLFGDVLEGGHVLKMEQAVEGAVAFLEALLFGISGQLEFQLGKTACEASCGQVGIPLSEMIGYAAEKALSRDVDKVVPTALGAVKHREAGKRKSDDVANHLSVRPELSSLAEFGVDPPRIPVLAAPQALRTQLGAHVQALSNQLERTCDDNLKKLYGSEEDRVLGARDEVVDLSRERRNSCNEACVSWWQTLWNCQGSLQNRPGWVTSK